MPDNVTVRDREGNAYAVSPDQLEAYQAQGFTPETDAQNVERVASDVQREEYGGAGGKIATAGLGALSGATLGLSDVGIAALGGGQALQKYQAENPYTSLGANILGSLAPTVLSGGATAGESAGLGAKILASSPAGIASKVGHAAGELVPGAGLASRVAAGTVGAAAEGSLYGGGQYLAQTAIEDKPLTASGFVAAMGKGALFAAPIGGAFTIAGETLQRARSLFPRSEMTPAAAKEAEQAATAELAQTVADGDSMVQAAQDRIAETQAQHGVAQAGEQVTRTVFGAAAPEAIADQVGLAAEGQKLQEAVGEYQAAKAKFDEWVATEASPELEAALSGLKAPDVGRPGGTIGERAVPVGEFGAPGARGYNPGEVAAPGPPSQAPLAQAAEGTPVTRALRKGAAPEVPAKEIVEQGASVGKRPVGMPAMPDGPASGLPDKAKNVGKYKMPAKTASAERPIEEMSLDQVDALQDKLNAEFDKHSPSSREYVELSQQWDRAVARREAIRTGNSAATAAHFGPPTLSEDEFDEFSKPWREELSVQEERALQTYAANGVYAQINAPLRLGEKLPEGLGDIARNMDAAIAKAPAPREMTVLRGLNDERALKQWGQVQPGDAIVDPGFGSTSTMEHVGAAYAKGLGVRPGIKLRVTIPEGFPAAPLPSDTFGSERELLLPRNTKYTISSVEAAPDGSRVIHAVASRATEGEASSVAALANRPTDINEMNLSQLNDYMDELHKRRIELDRPVTRDSAEFAQVRDNIETAHRRHYDIKSGKVPEPSGKAPTATAQPPSAESDLLAALQGTKSKLDAGESLIEMGAPARAAYKAAKAEKTSAAAEHFRAKATAAKEASSGEPESDLERLLRGTRDQIAQGKSMRDIGGAPAVSDQVGTRMPEGTPPQGVPVHGGPAELQAAIAKLHDPNAMPVSPAEYIARKEAMGVPDRPFSAALKKRFGKNVDMSASLGSAADAIGGVEAASAKLADALGDAAPATAVQRASKYRAALAEQADSTAANTASAAQKMRDATVVEPGLKDRMASVRADYAQRTVVDRTPPPLPEADRTVVDRGIAERVKQQSAAAPSPAPVAPGKSALGHVADVGTALEVMHALGVGKGVGAIPVIGPVLSLFFKARAALAIVGRRGGSIPRTTESFIAAKAAAVQDRINAATTKMLEVGIKAGRVAGPQTAAILSYRLFPGGQEPDGKDAQSLYRARMDELSRAGAPGAIAAMVDDHVKTADAQLKDEIAAQMQRGLKFLYDKAPKQTVMPGMVPGDGDWRPSKAAIDEWAKYVHYVNDPAAVLEELAQGKASMEGAETLATVYPPLFLQAQKALLANAQQLQKTLPYTTRAAISIMYKVPIDSSMTAQHAQFLAAPTPNAPARPGAPVPGPSPGAPALLGPLRTAQQTTPALDRRGV